MVRGEEVARVFAFVGVVGAVYAGAAAILVRRLLRRPAPPLGWKSRTVLLLAAAGVLAMLYGRFVEPEWIEVTETRIETARLPAGHRGIRIVHLSDIHSIETPHNETKLPAIVRGLAPDVIVFTGDAANLIAGIPTFRACMTEMAKIAPTFAVRGNWDDNHFREDERFAGTGAVELNGTAGEVDVAGTKLRIAGASFDGGGDAVANALHALPADGPAVVLIHVPYPELVPPESRSRVDVILAGHTHGGQVALPWYGALLTFSRHGKKYERGLYRTDEGPWMYVSRGIGLEGGPAPRVRFCARPEVALITLVPMSR